jgi:hypothetical protein
MPAKSEKQANFARMSMSTKGRKKLKASGRKPMPKKVAKHYTK